MKPAAATDALAVPYAIAAAAGAVLWLAGAEFTGRREAWDSGLYWTVFYPLALAACGLLGYFFPERPKRWAIALFLAQCLAMGIRNGEIGSLLPLGIIVFAVLSLPGVAVANLGARIRGNIGRWIR
jgi:hypothetical protein